MINKNDESRRINFGNKLKHLRETKGVTQAHMAKIIGIQPTSYASYEQGKNDPSIRNLKIISSFFDISLDELLEDENDEFERAKLSWESTGFKVEINSDNFVVLIFPTDFDELLSSTITDENSIVEVYKNVTLNIGNKATLIKMNDYANKIFCKRFNGAKNDIYRQTAFRFYEKVSTSKSAKELAV